VRVIHRLAIAIFLAAPVSAGEWPDFQAEGHGLRPQEQRVGALGFQVGLQGWPQLRKTAVPYYADGIPLGETAAIATIDLGAVATEGQPGKLALAETDWAHCVLSLGDSLKLHLSRLTPALVVECRKKTVTFFAGDKAPLPAFFAMQGTGSPFVFERGACPLIPGTGGQAPSPKAEKEPVPTQLKDMAPKDCRWLLVWFGKGGGFRSTRFPYCYDGRGWIPGPTASVDCPLLFVFPKTPTDLSLGRAGLAITFDELAGEGGRVAVLPLFGDGSPPVRETEGWSNALPDAVRKQCDWWSEHLAEVPLTATETYSYDEKSDTVTLETRVKLLRLRDGGTRFAPLPPMLALAREHGFPIEVSGQVVRTSVLTAIGPCAGIEGTDRYTCKVAGLGKYVLEHRVVAGPAKEPERLARMLREEVARVVQAGHLAPWYPAVNAYGAGYRTYLFLAGMLAWSNPGETLFVLGEILPLLDKETQGQLLAYLKKERTDYPPEKTAVLRVEEGARRERWRLEPAEIQDILLEHNQLVKTQNFYAVNRLIPEENLYYLAEFARRTGTDEVRRAWPEIRTILYPYLLRQDWATLGWYRQPGRNSTFDGLGGVVDASHHFAALVGALRLARAAGDAEGERLLWGHFARTAIFRYALGRYANYLHDSRFIVLPTDPGLTQEQYLDTCGEIAASGKIRSLWGKADWMARHFSGSWTGRLVTYKWTSAEDDVRSVVRLDEFGVLFDEVLTRYAGKGLLAYRGLTPELGRFLADHQQAKARVFVDRVAEHMPDWYLALCTANLGAEYNYLAPEDSYQCFLARAWILGEPPATLARFLDVPWMARGDLYYIHKLAETILAYRGLQWRPSRP